MSNDSRMAQMCQCMSAIRQAVEADRALEIKHANGNLRARADGRAHWSAAAYNFSRVTEGAFTGDGEDLKQLYNESGYVLF